jgi:hypothetical protein
MGYTHYWNQPRDFTAATWAEVCEDVRAILNNVQHVQGITLANGMGDAGTQPEITDEKIWFNGAGEDGQYETFDVWRKRPAKEAWEKRRGNNFCKTARRPYDLAVCAVLIYLEGVHGFRVSSDGEGFDWLTAVEVARAAVPRYANQFDIPLSVRKADRWDYRKLEARSNETEHFAIGACIDGKTYVFDVRDESRSYCFPTHEEANQFFAKHIEPLCKVKSQWNNGYEGGRSVFNATGSFDKARLARIKRQQTKILTELLESAAIVGRSQRPPAFARPNAIVPEAERNARSLADLFQLAA